ncbi:37367_t:CDS:2 [Gigaspora margarita]|uniref:37367_t:CDS:1 n=1 Tax=Gigaspora margarita TaxID=4874 RepID=A0ABN7V055_GIGMA|nr:37367_t:CDS:2 [Gigaspora margarita]
MGFLRGKFQEEVDWKALALNSISLLKDKIENKQYKLSKDDPLCIGIIDLSSDKYNISENIAMKNVCYEFISRRNEVQNSRKPVLDSREIVTHDQLVEADHVRGLVANGITNALLQEIKLNALRKVSEGSENTLVEIISRLLDMTMYHLPVDFEVEVTRSERQNSSKNWIESNKPDIMIRAYLRHKWEEMIFFEGGKWGAGEDKIFHDHNKLTQFCIAGSKELVKKSKIPLDKETVEEVEEFVHALLILRNGLIVNLQDIENVLKKDRKNKAL